MKSRANHFVSVILLTVYGMLTFVAMPFHHHNDPLFQTGNGHVALSQHHDTLSCHHTIAEIHDDCTVCSITSHSLITKVVAVIQLSNFIAAHNNSEYSFFLSQGIHSSHAYRGPPVSFV